MLLLASAVAANIDVVGKFFCVDSAPIAVFPAIASVPAVSFFPSVAGCSYCCWLSILLLVVPAVAGCPYCCWLSIAVAGCPLLLLVVPTFAGVHAGVDFKEAKSWITFLNE